MVYSLLSILQAGITLWAIIHAGRTIKRMFTEPVYYTHPLTKTSRLIPSKSDKPARQAFAGWLVQQDQQAAA
ncbi:hypothetical protein [Hymenobacter metallilatus]|uniref:Uncharacterized protein n=1 Tax=Hymenobacter metallilatus TaxID=2493666 RepID=A0A428IYE1_9BACT|nr:hypothetical protein [Hymenobacter metallilatus]RSK23956.1 hypothetical protein EI290_21450 [Hymenobacter metallilatus]